MLAHLLDIVIESRIGSLGAFQALDNVSLSNSHDDARGECEWIVKRLPVPGAAKSPSFVQKANRPAA